jgi:phage shock protein PspC (stress-responsive transcriptional regulator)
MSLPDELERLADLHARGVLDDDEFAQAKRMVLSGQRRVDRMDLQRSIHGLRRSPRDAYLGGICAGLGEATSLPAWPFRTLFVILGVSAGVGVALYLVLWVLIPPESPTIEASPPS